MLRRRPRPWLAGGLAFLTTVVIVDAVFGEAGYFARIRAGAEYDRRAARLAAIRHDNAALQQRARRLGEVAAVEEAARRELGMLRRGEILFVIHERGSNPESLPLGQGGQGPTVQ